jgi:hypothetical protein
MMMWKHIEKENNVMASLIQIKPNLYRYVGGKKVIYFSYETPIAYYDYIQEETVVSENVWTRTTAKHINHIKNEAHKYVVLPNDEFNLCLIDYS